MNFFKKLDAAVEKNNSLLCVGLDPDISKIPTSLTKQPHEYPFFEFCKAIVDTTHDLVCTYKPNPAFFEARGADGARELMMLCDYLNKTYPDIPILLDAKRGDIANTNAGYVRMAFDILHCDASTVQPYLGFDAMEPYFARHDKGIFVLVKTSNPGADEFQQLKLADGKPLYIHVAEKIARDWNRDGNCAIVAGATFPEEIAELRKVVGDKVMLVPGVGSQGGDLEKAVRAGLRKDGKGLIINASRGVLYAGGDEHFAAAARAEALKMRDAINSFRYKK